MAKHKIRKNTQEQIEIEKLIEKNKITILNMIKTITYTLKN